MIPLYKISLHFHLVLLHFFFVCVCVSECVFYDTYAFINLIISNKLKAWHVIDTRTIIPKSLLNMFFRLTSYILFRTLSIGTQNYNLFDVIFTKPMPLKKKKTESIISSGFIILPQVWLWYKLGLLTLCNIYLI